MSDEVYDFDAAVGEVEDEWWVFKFGGEEFKANVNVDGALILTWMRDARNTAAVPNLLEALLGEEEFKRLLNTKQPWPKYEALVVKVFEKLSGNSLPMV